MKKPKTEIGVQNYVSQFHENQRYQISYAHCYHSWWTKKMLSFLSLKGNILDNGCGTGILIKSLNKKKFNIVGVDRSYNMIKYAKYHSKRFVLGDSQQLPFQDAIFDIIVGRSLLHHLSDLSSGVAEMARLLKVNGEIILTDTNNSLLSILPRTLAYRRKHFSDDHRNMVISELTHIIEEYFRIDIIYYFGYLAYPIGFPDIIDIGKYLPYAEPLTKLLIKVDECISLIPWIKTQSWGVMIKATKI